MSRPGRTPTPAQIATARAREQKAREALNEAEQARIAASKAWQDAGQELLDLERRAGDLRDLILHRIENISPAPTLRRLVQYTRHDETEVAECVAQLSAEGLIWRDDCGWALIKGGRDR